jgi:hypothetical protein
MNNEKSVTAAKLDLERRHEKAGFLGGCFTIAGWREQDGEWCLALMYRLCRGLNVADSTEAEDVAAARKLKARLHKVFTEYLADPVTFKSRRRAATEVMLDEIRVETALRLHKDGTLEHVHRYSFPSDDAVVGLCIAHLADPAFRTDLIRKCQWEPCGRFFWRQGKRIYCCDECTNAADARFAVQRQKDFRHAKQSARRAK